MARQTRREKLAPLAIQYYERSVRFSEQLHTAWMYYEMQSEILRLVEPRCRDSVYQAQIVVETTSPVHSPARAPSRLRGHNLLGFIKRTHLREVPETVLLQSLSLFEAFVIDVAKLAYLADPERFLLRPIRNTPSEKASNQENIKLLGILIESSDRDEALERYIEEKLRGIFYGNPVDVFAKNKLGFNLDSGMKGHCATQLTTYAEVTARRNIIVHNLGKVDRKYIREVKGTLFTVGDTVEIDREYLFQALCTIDDLASEYVNGVSLSTVGKPLPAVRLGGITKRN